MRRIMLLAAATTMLMGSTVFAGEKIKLPNGPAKAKPQVTTAVQRTVTPVTNVVWGRRAWRNGYYGGYGGYGGYGSYYAPYSTYYRPYYSGYAPYYGGYTRPYYGYSYYSPGWYGGWGTGVSVGAGPLAYGRLGGWYW